MEPLTLFTWGYWGWGTATERLVQAVDAVEMSRAYRPPLFVDVRISRSVRAPGFNGSAFEKTLGPARYRWFESLGNLAIREGGPMRIKDPGAAEDLLDLAIECAGNRQRAVFFCSCEFPGIEGSKGCCHRTVVAGLVLDAARRRNMTCEIVEWPGGKPLAEGLEVHLSKKAFDKLNRGGKFVPLDEPVGVANMAAIPWCSVLAVHERGREPPDPFLLITGPARYRNGEWALPIFEDIDPEWSTKQVAEMVGEIRQAMGVDARTA